MRRRDHPPGPDERQKRYRGVSRREAAVNFAYDVERMSVAGFVPVSQRWEGPGKVHVSRGFPWWTTRRPGTLTVVYRGTGPAGARGVPVDLDAVPDQTQPPMPGRRWLPRPILTLIRAYERRLGRLTVRAGSGCLVSSLVLIAAAATSGRWLRVTR